MYKNIFRKGSEIQVLFKDLNQIQGLFKTTSKIQDLLKIVRTMYNPIQCIGFLKTYQLDSDLS